MTDKEIGYQEDPENGYEIVRARTTLRIRSWEFPRSEKALEVFNSELGKIDYPGVYILFEGKSKVYIGEAKNVYLRIKNHLKIPVDKIGNWKRVLIINDGRPATQSDFNDHVIRLSTEYYLKKLFTINKYQVVSQAEPQNLNPIQKYITESLLSELNIFLTKKNLITKLIEEKGQEEIFSDELKKLIKKSGKQIERWSAYEAIIDGQKHFIRPGSKKPKGWQVTFRGRKPGSFIDSLYKGTGFLLFSRDGVPIIPLSKIQDVIDDDVYNQDTIDIWLTFSEDKLFLSYRKNIIDITEYRLLK